VSGLLLLAVVVWPAAAQRAPLTLERAVAVAVERSRDIRDAELALEVAQRQVREAWGNVFPTLTMNASYTRNLVVPGSFLPRVFIDPDAGPDELILVRFGADNNWNFSLRAEQPLFRAAAFIGVGAAARYEALQAEALRGRTHSVAARTQVAFFDALLAQEGVRLTENTVQRIRQALDEMRQLEAAGLASSYDVLRLEVELANVEPELRRMRNRAYAARRALAVELGEADLEGMAIAGSLAAVDVDSLHAATGGPESGAAARAAIVREALVRRSELRQLELTEALRTAELRAEQSEYLPQISLFGTYSIAAQQSGRPDFFASPDQRAFGRQVGLQVSMPLFSGMQRPARTAQHRLAIEQVRTQYALAVDQIEHQVVTLLDQVEEARARARAQRLGVQQARRGFQIATAQYREGIGSALELTDAEGALRQSEFNYAEAVYDYLVARARLDEATGRLDYATGTGIRTIPEESRQ
jgi:outer membrane protein TolC